MGVGYTIMRAKSFKLRLKGSGKLKGEKTSKKKTSLGKY
jgi:hypothetical protein